MFKAYVSLLASIVLISCAHQPERSPREAKQALQQQGEPGSAKPQREQLPDDVRRDLFADSSENPSAATDVLAEPRFTVQANNINSREFLPAWRKIPHTAWWFTRTSVAPSR